VIVFSLFWRRFNTTGAVAGLGTGLVASLTLILVSPSIMGADRALFPLENPGIVSIPLGFIAAVAATLLTRDPGAEEKFDELIVRANTGLGAEQSHAG
jgi:cation/acetate symporter